MGLPSDCPVASNSITYMSDHIVVEGEHPSDKKEGVKAG